VDDPWCTLCYTDLRAATAPAPAQELQTVPAAPAPESSYSHLHDAAPAHTAPAHTAPEPVVDPADPLGVGVPADEPAKSLPRWTCVACASQASYDELSCPTCGRALLADDSPPLPAIIRPGSAASKLGVIAGGMAAVMVVIMTVLFIVGSML
jgi:hypothetical protein